MIQTKLPDSYFKMPQCERDIIDKMSAATESEGQCEDFGIITQLLRNRTEEAYQESMRLIRMLIRQRRTF